jgi:methionyl aminopeptidase
MKRDAMQEGGAKLGGILQKLLAAAKPGVSLNEIEALAVRLIRQAGGTPSFKTVRGYKWATCLCVDDVVVHGVPSPYILKDGDVLTIDVGLLYKGFHTDTAWTKIVGEKATPATRKFLRIGEKALWKAISEAKGGHRVGHISRTIQEHIEGAGYTIVESLVGHGVGRQLHESPQVPGFLEDPTQRTPKLIPGMTIAIEVIYAQGKGEVVYDTGDGWSIATKDGSLSAVFEHTIAVSDGVPLVLTKAPDLR